MVVADFLDQGPGLVQNLDLGRIVAGGSGNCSQVLVDAKQSVSEEGRDAMSVYCRSPNCGEVVCKSRTGTVWPDSPTGSSGDLFARTPRGADNDNLVGVQGGSV